MGLGDLQRQPVSPPVPVTSAPSPRIPDHALTPPATHALLLRGLHSPPLCVSRPFSPLKAERPSEHPARPPFPLPIGGSALSLRQALKLAPSLGCSLPGSFRRLYRWHHREVPQACGSVLQGKELGVANGDFVLRHQSEPLEESAESAFLSLPCLTAQWPHRRRQAEGFPRRPAAASPP